MINLDSPGLSGFFSGQYEGIWLVLEALYEYEQSQLESVEYQKIDRSYVKEKLIQLGLTDFTDGIVNTYLPIKEEK